MSIELPAHCYGQSPLVIYQQLQQSARLKPDAAQQSAIQMLDQLWRQLIEFKKKRDQFLGRSLLSPEVPQGLYLWGGVGRGKTLLMDIFYACLPYRRKRRLHFHDFMIDVHHQLRQHANSPDPLLAVAAAIVKANRVLCLDEFQVVDIADAMILSRLLNTLFEQGLVLLTTSNSEPDQLYLNGLQRQNFLPAIALIKQQLTVLNVDGTHDHRQQMRLQSRFVIGPDRVLNEQILSARFQQLNKGAAFSSQTLEICDRNLPFVKRGQGLIWLDFAELCGGAHAHEDYLELAKLFPVIFLSHLPQLGPEQSPEARRLTWLIDVLYDARIQLYASLAVTPEQLYLPGMTSGEFVRTASRLGEMQSETFV